VLIAADRAGSSLRMSFGIFGDGLGLVFESHGSFWLKRSHENDGSGPLNHTQHYKQKHRTKRGDKNAAQQATSGEAGEATE